MTFVLQFQRLFSVLSVYICNDVLYIIILLYGIYKDKIPTLVLQHKSHTPHGSMHLSTKLHREARNSDASTCGQVEFTMGVDRERRY